VKFRNCEGRTRGVNGDLHSTKIPEKEREGGKVIGENLSGEEGVKGKEGKDRGSFWYT